MLPIKCRSILTLKGGLIGILFSAFFSFTFHFFPEGLQTNLKLKMLSTLPHRDLELLALVYFQKVSKLLHEKKISFI